MQLLKGSDIQFTRKHRLDIALCTNMPMAIVFLPAADIADFVGKGNIDIGITGQDVVAESGVHVEETLKLGFGKCRLSVQVPIDSGIQDVKQLVGKRVVTSFDRLVKQFFAQLEGQKEVKGSGSLSTSVDFVSGSVEAACALGLADGIGLFLSKTFHLQQGLTVSLILVDLVESGETMRAAKLHEIHTLLTTEAVLIVNRKKDRDQDHLNLIQRITRRIQGVIDASKFVLCNYNVPRTRLKEAVAVTPGKKAPTISPLEDDDWVAASSMILKNQTAEIMDRLEKIGATDILIFDIQNCRV